MQRLGLVLFLLLGSLLAACAKEPEPGQALKISQQVKLSSFKSLKPLSLSWGNLMPADYVPVAQIFPWLLEDGEKRMQETLQETPVVEALDGQVVKVSGYVVPLAGDEAAITEFLLVPFLGACIHVPPPPANQIVYVKPSYPLLMEESWGVISVLGVLSAKGKTSGYGAAGYVMESAFLSSFDASEYAGIIEKPVVVDTDGIGQQLNSEPQNTAREKP